MFDLYGRKINYLRISVTDLCDLRCKYCIPEDGIKKMQHKEILTLEEIQKVTEKFVDIGVDKVRITGGEPSVRNNILKLIEGIGKMDKVKDLAMTTNGTLLKKYARDLKNAGLNRLNISLDTLNDEKYSKITKIGKLKDVLEGIEAAKKERLDLLIRDGLIKKGDVLAVAQVGGIMGVKRTSDLIPMCHNIFITGSDIKFNVLER